MGYGEAGRPRVPVVELADRRALERWRPADEEVVEAARLLKERALLELGMTHSAIASWLFSKCHHQLPTTAVDTAAVVASGDGSCLLLYNPAFFVGIGGEGVRFVLFHEARHLVQRHLFADADLRGDPVFTLACEVTINHVAMVRLGTGLPEIDGAPVGISPRRVHGDYAADLREQGAELGHEPMLARRGPQRVKSLVVALDTSGSMPDGLVEWLAGLVGRIDGAEAEWIAFDASVKPFRPGEALRGGGGTDFGALRRHVEARDEPADAVIVVTDGHAEPVVPADPGRWIWLITSGGDEWPQGRGMACHRVRPA